MDIVILRGFCWGEGRDVAPGQLVPDAPDQLARDLIRAGKARPVRPGDYPAATETRDPEPEAPAPRPAKRRK